jgi:hypothetical protein
VLEPLQEHLVGWCLVDMWEWSRGGDSRKINTPANWNACSGKLPLSTCSLRQQPWGQWPAKPQGQGCPRAWGPSCSLPPHPSCAQDTELEL